MDILGMPSVKKNGFDQKRRPRVFQDHPSQPLLILYPEQPEAQQEGLHLQSPVLHHRLGL